MEPGRKPRHTIGRRWRRVLPALGMLLLVGARAEGSSTNRSPNVIVILIDTLRADRLGAYGNSRGLSPFLDTLAARGTVFTHAYAPSPWTNPSVASLFTSRFQSQHGVVSFNSRLDASELTIAEVLQSHGYATGAFIANGVINESNGYAQGFGTFRSYWLAPGPSDSNLQKKRAEALAPDVMAWLDGLPATPQGPLFLYLHYVEPHVPYSPPKPMLDHFFAGRTSPDLGTLSASIFLGNVFPPSAETLRDIEDVYDAEVLALDVALRDTFAALETRHVLDNAIVVVTADHGEEFREHGHMGHGNSLYDEVIHVPLIVLVPDQITHTEVREPVSLVDVAPTLLDLIGAAQPATFEGRSLRASLPGAAHWFWDRLAALWPGPVSARPVLSELIVPNAASRLTPHERAVVLEGRKLIVGIQGEREEYDLVHDPAETVHLEETTAGARELAAALHEFETRLGASHPTQTTPLSPELRERLKALGYAQ
jgi:arylsulfatase A-like enzyme